MPSASTRAQRRTNRSWLTTTRQMVFHLRRFIRRMLLRAASGRDLCSSTNTWYTMAHASVQTSSSTLTARYSPKYSGVSPMTSMMYSGTVICRTRSETTKKFVKGMMTAVNTSSEPCAHWFSIRASFLARRASALFCAASVLSVVCATGDHILSVCGNRIVPSFYQL